MDLPNTPDEIVDTITVSDNTTAAKAVLLTMMRESDNDAVKHFHINRKRGELISVDVRMSINGIAVSFIDIITELHRRLVNQHDRDVEKAARSIIQQTSFDDINNTISKAQQYLDDQITVILNRHE